MIGQILGNYRILEQLGWGGIFTVYKAYDPDTDCHVVIQVVRQELAGDPNVRDRIRQEFELFQRLDHPNALSALAYNEGTDIVYSVYPYLDGDNLEHRISQGPLSLSEVSSILSQIASALDHAHSQGILHLDVTTTNVLVDSIGKAYLVDWGFAVVAKDISTRSFFGGNSGYASPEQLTGTYAVTPASDVYSLGILVYEMLTGHLPFRAREPMVMMMKQLNDPLPLPRNFRPDLPESAERVILKALATKPESRYQTAGAMADAFAKAVSSCESSSEGQPEAKNKTDYQRIEDIKQLIYKNSRALQKLKEQQASFGLLHIPAHILVEIEDREAEIENLQAELKEIQAKIVPPAQ